MSEHDDDNSWGFGDEAQEPISALIDHLDGAGALSDELGDFIFAALRGAFQGGRMEILKCIAAEGGGKEMLVAMTARKAHQTWLQNPNRLQLVPKPEDVSRET